jgi:hypothetical protein
MMIPFALYLFNSCGDMYSLLISNVCFVLFLLHFKCEFACLCCLHLFLLSSCLLFIGYYLSYFLMGFVFCASNMLLVLDFVM